MLSLKTFKSLFSVSFLIYWRYFRLCTIWKMYNWVSLQIRVHFTVHQKYGHSWLHTKFIERLRLSQLLSEVERSVCSKRHDPPYPAPSRPPISNIITLLIEIHWYSDQKRLFKLRRNLMDSTSNLNLLHLTFAERVPQSIFLTKTNKYPELNHFWFSEQSLQCRYGCGCFI